MKLITELNEDVSYITEENNGKKSLFIEGVFMQGGIKNRNGRIYPMNVLEKEVQRYDENYVQKNRAFGELGHPQGPSINLDKISHRITSLRIEGNNIIGKAQISNTPMGKIAEGIISDGGVLGVSSRGMGSVKINSKGINEVQNDFYLATAADIVHDPSAPDAFVNGIMEGVEWIYDEKLGLQSINLLEQQKKDIAANFTRLTPENKLSMFEAFIRSL